MQNLIYDEAPYDVLYYDANLDAYRTDRFAGWQNMPADGTPLFTYGTLQYTLLTDATAQPSPTPAAATEAPATADPAATEAPATPAPSADGGTAADTDSPSTTLLVIVIVAAVIIGIVFIWLINSRRRKGEPDDDE